MHLYVVYELKSDKLDRQRQHSQKATLQFLQHLKKAIMAKENAADESSDNDDVENPNSEGKSKMRRLDTNEHDVQPSESKRYRIDVDTKANKIQTLQRSFQELENENGSLKKQKEEVQQNVTVCDSDIEKLKTKLQEQKKRIPTKDDEIVSWNDRLQQFFITRFKFECFGCF